MLKSKRHTLTVEEFIGLYNSGKLIMMPSYQRGWVWSPSRVNDAINALINRDVSLMGPPITLSDRIKYTNVVDGGNRLLSIVHFITEKDVNRKNFGAKIRYNKKLFSELPEKEQNRILKTRFRVDEYEGLTDDDEVRLFEALNNGQNLTRGERSQADKLLADNGKDIDLLKKDIMGMDIMTNYISQMVNLNRKKDVSMFVQLLELMMTNSTSLVSSNKATSYFTETLKGYRYHDTSDVRNKQIAHGKRVAKICNDRLMHNGYDKDKVIEEWHSYFKILGIIQVLSEASMPLFSISDTVGTSFVHKIIDYLCSHNEESTSFKFMGEFYNKHVQSSSYNKIVKSLKSLVIEFTTYL